jgi:hypothetical protein
MSSAPLTADQLESLERDGFVLLYARRASDLIPTTLVLGMAYFSESHAAVAAAAERQGTTTAGLRDRARLLQLEELTGHRIVSMNDVHTAAQCERGQHLQGRFDRRAVDELEGRLVLGAIYGDYFRFPGAYMRNSYGEFLRSMLPALIEKGVIGVCSQLILPNLERLFSDVETKLFKLPAGGQCRLTFEPLVAADNPLFVATEAIHDKTVLGGYSNQLELTQLDSTHPFMLLRIVECQKSKGCRSLVSRW